MEWSRSFSSLDFVPLTGVTGSNISSDVFFHVFPLDRRDHGIVCLVTAWVTHERRVVKEANKFASKFVIIGDGDGERIGWEIVTVEEELDGGRKGKDFTSNE